MNVSFFLMFLCSVSGLKPSPKQSAVKTFQKNQYNIQSNSEVLPFRDTNLPITDRVDDLVSRLTLNEVVEQIARGGARDNGPSPEITRLDIKPYQWTTECLHGYLNQGTIFPQAIGLAATFSKELIRRMTSTIAIEARAQHNYFMKNQLYGDQTGLSCFAPVVNIMRHPLWGRNQETYGEDPFLTSHIASAYISGLQGEGRFAAATATCKHFGVHGGPENIPVSRFSFNSQVSLHDLGTTFLPSFRKCVKSGAHAVMCSYNAINGVPACANEMMMGDILRNKFAFKGYVVSDEGAIESIDTDFKYTKSKNSTAKVAHEAGVDLELKGGKQDNRFDLLLDLVKDNKTSEEGLRVSAKRLFTTRMMLGEFDPPETLPWFNLSLDVLQSKEHLELATEVAAKSFVLLKNDGFLPMKILLKTAAMVGPFGENQQAISGDYVRIYDGEQFLLPSYAIKYLATFRKVVSGCVGAWDKNLPHCESYNSTEVKEAVSDADVVFVTLGTGPGVEAEGNDRRNLDLPGNQKKLLSDVVQFAPKKAKIVVLLFNGGPVDVSWAVKSSRVNSILECFLPAQRTGEALLRVLYGSINPAGRLPYTWYADMDQVPSMTNYSMVGRTYKYFYGVPLFPFGYGLSYSNFSYNRVTVSPKFSYACEMVELEVEVENKGRVDGDEVIQVYMRRFTDVDLIHHLVAFERVHIKSGEKVVVKINIGFDGRMVWKCDRGFCDYFLTSGQFQLYIGGQQPGQVVHASSNILETVFVYEGRDVLVSDCER